jgi:hypothetical protein
LLRVVSFHRHDGAWETTDWQTDARVEEGCAGVFPVLLSIAFFFLMCNHMRTIYTLHWVWCVRVCACAAIKEKKREKNERYTPHAGGGMPFSAAFNNGARRVWLGRVRGDIVCECGEPWASLSLSLLLARDAWRGTRFAFPAPPASRRLSRRRRLSMPWRKDCQRDAPLVLEAAMCGGLRAPHNRTNKLKV